MGIALVGIVLFMMWSAYTWVRMDSLADRAALAARGTLLRRVLLRQMLAATGWYVTAGALAMATVHVNWRLTGPTLVFGLSLIAEAVTQRRRDLLPRHRAL